METFKARKPHVLAVPAPAQSHVNSLMKLSRQLARHGIKVTFVNLESIHEKLVAAAKLSGAEQTDQEDDNLILASIPDTRSPEEQKDAFKLMETLRKTMPGPLTDLIERINSSNPAEKIACVIADLTIGWVLETAEKIGARPFAFSAVSAASFAIGLHIPKLIEYGILDPNGNIYLLCSLKQKKKKKSVFETGLEEYNTLAMNVLYMTVPLFLPGSMKRGEIISLSDGIPAWRKNEFLCSFPSNLQVQKLFFEAAQDVDQKLDLAKWTVLINTCHELESAACDLSPNLPRWAIAPV